MTPETERRLLQVAIAIGGLVPVGAGLLGVIAGAAMTGVTGDTTPPAISLDSHVRYLSGLLLCIGLVFWASIPAIERHTARVRLLTMIVFVGGLARLYGLHRGMPTGSMVFALTMELVVTPLLCLWQGRVARRFNR